MPRLPSVTEVIGFVNSRAFDDIPAFRLAAAQARGVAVHSIAANYLLGLWYDDADYAGYVQSMATWVDNFVIQVVLVEQGLVDPVLGFQGHPDALLRIEGDEGLTLVDWKTPKPLSKSWRLQLAGYKLLVEANGHKVSRVASLRLDADGGLAKFQGYSKTMAADANVFRSALNVWKFFNQK